MGKTRLPRRSRVAARLVLVGVMTWLATMGLGPQEAHARCVTVGADSISHTQCNLP